MSTENTPEGGPHVRSGVVASVLSFILPGLGQSYLRHTRAALLFAVPVLLLFLVLGVVVVRSGLTRTGAKLLDPSIATAGALVILVLGIWWIAAILTAWRAGRRASGAAAAVPIALVVVVAGASVYGADWMWRLSQADQVLSASVDCTIVDCNTASAVPDLTPGSSLTDELPSTAAISPSATEPLGYAPATSSPGSASASSSPFDCGDYCPDSPEPLASIVPGPSPSFDITKVDTQNNGWLNVLLLGLDTRCAGGIVTGANTDTMIVVSVELATNEVYMFSFPRDSAQFPLYVGGTMPGYWKLNSFAGYTKFYPDTFPNPGQPALANEIGFLLGMPINYYASINICGFPQLIDQLGGVDVCNTATIDDPTYPWMNGQFGFHLAPGEYHMDGATALAYARSRHGSSDFARARRQQQLLTAIRQAIMQPQNLANLPSIVAAMGNIVHTNFPPDQIDQLLNLSNEMGATPTAQYVFQYPTWATHLPDSQTNGRSVQFLNMDEIVALSEQIFGDASLYTKAGVVPKVAAPPPDASTPSSSSSNGGGSC